MKGASPVARSQQAEIEIGTWLRGNIGDSSGALSTVIHRHLKGSDALLENVEQPLTALAAYCRRILASDRLIEELVDEADREWGRAMDERPYFQRQGAPAHPDDPYTVESVRKRLSDVLMRLDPQ